MTPSGEIVNLRWSGREKKGNKPFDYGGIGLPVPGFLAAQWDVNKEGGGGVGVDMFEGDTLTGMFAEGEGTGQEKLTVPPEVVERLRGQ